MRLAEVKLTSMRQYLLYLFMLTINCVKMDIHLFIFVALDYLRDSCTVSSFVCACGVVGDSFSRYHLNLVFNNMCWIFDSISNVFILALHYLLVRKHSVDIEPTISSSTFLLQDEEVLFELEMIGSLNKHHLLFVSYTFS